MSYGADGKIETPRRYPSPPSGSVCKFHKKYHGLLYILYEHLDHGPLTVKEWWALIGGQLTEDTGIDKWINLRRNLYLISNGSQFVYVFETYPYGPKKYIISIRGIEKLRALGLITNEEAASAKQRLLGVLDGCMDESRLNRILKRTKF